MAEIAIEARGLRKSFGTKTAVAGIDLEIAAGSLAGLVGPNGAGKTTSLSMMTGLLRPDGGQVLINGRYRNVAIYPQEDLAVALLLISDRPPPPRRQLSVQLRRH